jgi:hypothetical protein
MEELQLMGKVSFQSVIGRSGESVDFYDFAKGKGRAEEPAPDLAKSAGDLRKVSQGGRPKAGPAEFQYPRFLGKSETEKS